MPDKPKYIRKLKAGHLVCRWATSRDDGPDLYYNAGPGCSGDMRLLHGFFTCQRMDYNQKTFVEELESRGYDITTLNFSIKKKTT